MIFRATPQWFIAMDKADRRAARTRCATRALKAIDETHGFRRKARTASRGMIETRPDWVVSRQRAWGVPITVFVTRRPARHPARHLQRLRRTDRAHRRGLRNEGADAWFKPAPRERFLDGLVDNPTDWEKVDDILDVWFDSGSTHAFVLETAPDLALAGLALSRRLRPASRLVPILAA